MAPRCTPYISFPGNASEAFPYYRDLFGGQLDVMTYDQFPSTEGFPFTPPPDSVAHATLTAPGITLTGGDGMGDDDVYDMGTTDDNGINTNEGNADGGMRTDADNGGLLFDDGADGVVNY